MGAPWGRHGDTMDLPDTQRARHSGPSKTQPRRHGCTVVLFGPPWVRHGDAMETPWIYLNTTLGIREGSVIQHGE